MIGTLYLYLFKYLLFTFSNLGTRVLNISNTCLGESQFVSIFLISVVGINKSP